jgi:adenylate kinase
MHNLIVFGPPGSGKGTQSARLVRRYGLDHLSTGAMLRDEVASGSMLGLELQETLKDGELVADAIVLRMALRFAVERSSGKGVVFDGFPRTQRQAELLDRVLRKKGLSIDLVIYIDISEEEVCHRILRRSRDSQRMDDREEVITRRIGIFREQTFPVVQYYHRQGKFARVSGMDSVDEVFSRICQVIERRIPELDNNAQHGR